MFYRLMLSAHNLTRWLVVLGAVWALARAYRGWLGNRAWAEADRRAGLAFSIVYDVQMLLGLVLAFVSPLIQAALADLSAAMKVPQLRFIVVEHIPLLLVGLVIVHVTGSQVKRAQDERSKHRRAAIGYSAAMLALLIAIPWWQPLIRGLG